ncbi:hypothetical protein HDU87_000530 [Geranomyces variabilis]|uniref:Uncharacterized protein n=1 Tax=Geranomyces variabilis TaxID=109894 RepID=A0AAD5XNV4_9FUNG|nr:hypothetical protein HDU87_000530 [Geranomyces variabilis]
MQVTGASSLTGALTATAATFSQIVGVTGIGTFNSDILLTGATSKVIMPSTGLGPPSTGTRSAGSKLILLSAVDVSAADYALGIEAQVLWSSVANATGFHRWYAGAVNTMSLSGTGDLTTTGVLSITGPRTGPPSATTGAFLNISPSTFNNSTTVASGTVGSFFSNYIVQPTLTATNTAVTTTSASTLFIAGVPIGGLNMAVSNSFAVYVGSGITCLFDATDASALSASLLLAGGLTMAKTLYMGSGKLPSVVGVHDR